jgi:chromosomal replication initiator protein
VANSDLAEVWARSLDGLADLQIQPHQRAWLKLTRPLGLVENTALIATPNEFVKEQLETRLRALVTQALSQQLGRDIQLAVTVDPAPVATPSPVAPHSPAPEVAAPAGLAGVPISRRNLPPRSGRDRRSPRTSPARGWAPRRPHRTLIPPTTATMPTTAPASPPPRTRAVRSHQEPQESPLPHGSAAPG